MTNEHKRVCKPQTITLPPNIYSGSWLERDISYIGEYYLKSIQNIFHAFLYIYFNHKSMSWFTHRHLQIEIVRGKYKKKCVRHRKL